MADVAELLAPIFQRFNPIGRNLLAGYTLAGAYLCSGGRRVRLTQVEGLHRSEHLSEAIVVLAVDLGLLRVRHFKGARRWRQELMAAATTFLALGLVGAPEDDPGAAHAARPKGNP